MAKNEFLLFGTAANANVLTNAEYTALPARGTGFQSGIAKSKELNTAWRQASVIANVVAQFIADNSGKDALDNGDAATLKSNLEAALVANTAGSLKSGVGYQSMPGGLTFQWGVVFTSVAGSATLVTFPIPFTKSIASINATRTSSSATDTSNSIAVAPSGLTGFNVIAREDNITAYWLAVGY